ncbi:MAG: NfeD family protein [Fusicatenibacter sp.]
MNAVCWLIALVILLVIEAATLGLTTIWFAGGALIALIASMFGANFWVQMGCFILVSLILLIFTRPAAVRYMNKDTLKTNVEGVVGMEAVVTEDIDNLLGTGKASLNGNPWTARSETADIRIAAGTTVEVIRVEGVKLIVKEKVSDKSKEVKENG